MARPPADGELTAVAPAEKATGVGLATRADEAEVRALLRSTVMDGAVRVAFTREPDYFAGEGLAGALDRTTIVRAPGRADAMGRLSLHTLHRNGAARRIGYLGELRLAPEVPNAVRRLRDGYAFLKDHFIADGAEGCFTSVAAENHRARRVLEHGGRLGLPTYVPIADLETRLAPVHRALRAKPLAHADTVVDRDELTAFLEHHARAAHLAPTWDDARWTALAVHGIGPSHFVVVRARGRMVAAAAVWDQRAFRQTLICGYQGALRWSRPFLNVLARAGLAPSLPAPGTVVRQASVLGAAVDHDRHWPTLWSALRAAAAPRGIEWLIIARAAGDPQLEALRRVVGGRAYRTRLYAVRWPDAPAFTDAWDSRPFRPEVALL